MSGALEAVLGRSHCGLLGAGHYHSARLGRPRMACQRYVDGRHGHDRAWRAGAFAAVHGPDLLDLSVILGLGVSPMRRREFITIISGAAVTWPVVGHAQQREMPVVGVLCAGTAQALERYLASFREGMRQLGYVEGSNPLRVSVR